MTLKIPDFNDFLIRFENRLKSLKFDSPDISKLKDLFNNVLLSLQLLTFDDAFKNRSNYQFKLWEDQEGLTISSIKDFELHNELKNIVESMERTENFYIPNFKEFQAHLRDNYQFELHVEYIRAVHVVEKVQKQFKNGEGENFEIKPKILNEINCFPKAKKDESYFLNDYESLIIPQEQIQFEDPECECFTKCCLCSENDPSMRNFKNYKSSLDYQIDLFKTNKPVKNHKTILNLVLEDSEKVIKLEQAPDIQTSLNKMEEKLRSEMNELVDKKMEKNKQKLKNYKSEIKEIREENKNKSKEFQNKIEGVVDRFEMEIQKLTEENKNLKISLDNEIESNTTKLENLKSEMGIIINASEKQVFRLIELENNTKGLKTLLDKNCQKIGDDFEDFEKKLKNVQNVQKTNFGNLEKRIEETLRNFDQKNDNLQEIITNNETKNKEKTQTIKNLVDSQKQEIQSKIDESAKQLEKMKQEFNERVLKIEERIKKQDSTIGQNERELSDRISKNKDECDENLKMLEKTASKKYEEIYQEFEKAINNFKATCFVKENQKDNRSAPVTSKVSIDNNEQNKNLQNGSVDELPPKNLKQPFTSNVIKDNGKNLTDISVEEEESENDKRKKKFEKIGKKQTEKDADDSQSDLSEVKKPDLGKGKKKLSSRSNSSDVQKPKSSYESDDESNHKSKPN